jgi:hypothetical protein
MLIVVSSAHPGLYESLKPAQEANGRDRVILDRRVADQGQRRGRGRPGRRPGEERRAAVSPAERALMNVLGFTVVQRDEPAILALPARPAVRKPGQRALAAPGRRPRASRALGRAAG